MHLGWSMAHKVVERAGTEELAAALVERVLFLLVEAAFQVQFCPVLVSNRDENNHFLVRQTEAVKASTTYRTKK